MLRIVFDERSYLSCRFSAAFVAAVAKVTPSELAEIMRGLGDKLSDDEINLLVKVADKDGDGTISIEE